MRHLIYLDEKINQDRYEAWRNEDQSFWKMYSNITPSYWSVRQDFKDYPWRFDNDYDVRPTDDFLQSLVDDAVNQYGEFAFDFILVCIHEDNWQSSGPLFDAIQRRYGHNKKRGIWGTNYSYIYGNQHVQYCRWDKDSLPNVFGTLYHERMHAMDSLCEVEVNIDIRPKLNVARYDAGVVHGGESPWQYIRHKENSKAVVAIANDIEAAFAARKQKHQDNQKRKTIVDLLQQVVYWYRKLVNRKNGMAGLPKSSSQN